MSHISVTPYTITDTKSPHYSPTITHFGPTGPTPLITDKLSHITVTHCSHTVTHFGPTPLITVKLSHTTVTHCSHTVTEFAQCFQVKSMIAEADLDGDGRINFHEFARLMQQQQQHQQQQQQQQHNHGRPSSSANHHNSSVASNSSRNSSKKY